MIKVFISHGMAGKSNIKEYVAQCRQTVFLTAAGLVMRELHQPYPVVKAMPTGELILFATMVASMSGRKF